MFSYVLLRTDTKRQSETAVNKQKMAVYSFPEGAKKAVSRLKTVVQLRVFVLVHERTPLNIR